MFLEKSISNGKAYLSFVQGYRENGNQNNFKPIYSRVKQLVPIDTQIGYYDITNFYFEIPYGKKLSLDLKKIAAEEKYDGYYSIVTSEKTSLIKRFGTFTVAYGRLRNLLRLLRVSLKQELYMYA